MLDCYTIEDKVQVAGIGFKKWVLGYYRVLWHTLSDTTLREALELWYMFN